MLSIQISTICNCFEECNRDKSP
uniref:Uncharacterized protein n=1 Tax=Rhizophora mucronata TaxID=61149 RepID=A0A2P2QCG0_RHIMU